MQQTRVSLIGAFVILWLATGGGTAVRADDGAIFALQPVTYNPDLPATRSYFIMDTQPGVTLTSELRVTNGGKTPGTARIYPVDGTTGNTSGTVFLGEDDARADVGSWIALAATTLTLAPGESRIISFRVTVPVAPRPGQHVGGIVAENAALQAATGAEAVQVNIRHRNIIAVQVDLPGAPVEAVAVTGVGAGGEQGYQTLSLGLRNTGTMMLKPKGTLEVRDAAGTVVQNLPLALDTFLPQTQISYPVNLQRALGPGTYEATIDLRYGNGQETHAVERFAVTTAQVQQTFQGSQPLAPPAGFAPNAAANGGAGPAPAAAPELAAIRQFGDAVLPTVYRGVIGAASLLALAAFGVLAYRRRTARR